MQIQIDQALNRFESLCDNWGVGYGNLRKHSTFVYLWTPPAATGFLPIPSKKSIGLTLQAITHGNEVGGILALIECLRLLQSGTIKPRITLGFVLGNPLGAKANRRFLESDLNRSFGSTLTTLEGQRAKHLEPILEQSDFFLDFHQTIERSAQPFFIFPYTADGLDFAKASHADVSVVTHWGKSFSLDGMCSDEYVNFKGGTGITIELGMKGFEPYQTSVGLHAALGAMRYAQQQLIGSEPPYIEQERISSPLFTWKAIELYQEGMDLKEGLYNFQPVKKGEVLGVHGEEPLLCREDGWLLFPKYHRDPLAPRAKEIYRVAKTISNLELGKPGVVGV